MRGDVAATLQLARAGLALATEHGFPHLAAIWTIWRGWALTMREKSEEGMAQLTQGNSTDYWRCAARSSLTSLVRALDVARRQQAKLLKLGAASSLRNSGRFKASNPTRVISSLRFMAALLRAWTLST